MNAEDENQSTIESEHLKPIAASVAATNDSGSGLTRAKARNIGTETQCAAETIQPDMDHEGSKPDTIRDAGRGKTRGPNGQYLPKDKAKKQKGKGAKSSQEHVDMSR